MRNLIIKKASWTIISLVLALSMLASPGANNVNAGYEKKVFYVSPNGKPGNDGSMERPWDLQTALNQPKSVQPNARIIVRGGRYKGAFVSRLKGAPEAPIYVRARPGERVTLINNDGPVLDIAHSYHVIFWGLEITSEYSSRKPSRSESTYGIRVNQGEKSHHISFINMIIHDMRAQGIGWWQALADSRIYGSLFYYNGTTQLDHGVYTHSKGGSKLFLDNIVFDNAGHGFHAYTQTNEKALDGFRLEGNTFFNNGSIGYTTHKEKYGIYKRNILVGGSNPARTPVIRDNYTYYPGGSGVSLNLGYKGGSTNAVVQNNYLMGGALEIKGKNSGLNMSGNTFLAPGGIIGIDAGRYGNNKWLRADPKGVRFFVQPNEYEKNRANLTIYNWDRQKSVAIPASARLGS